MSEWRLRAWVLPLGLSLAACANTAPPKAPPHEAAFLQENDVAMERMMAGMEAPPTGDIDRDFARMMIPHHQGAIDMAEALLRHGKNEELKALARAIIAKQSEEIAMMRRITGEAAPAMAAQMDMSEGSHHHH